MERFVHTAMHFKSNFYTYRSFPETGARTAKMFKLRSRRSAEKYELSGVPNDELSQLRAENAKLREELSLRAENEKLKAALKATSKEKEAMSVELAAVKRDYAHALERVADLAHRVGTKKRTSTDGMAWFRCLDLDGDGTVTLNELLEGLEVSHLLTQARDGWQVPSSRWDESFAQVNELLTVKPDFAEGHRLKLILGTISDRYSDVFAAADGLLSVAPNDPQALLLKALYAKSLDRVDSFMECQKALQATTPDVHALLLKIVQSVAKYWDGEISGEVPQSADGSVAIVALGSPADDDGTPRPRLLGTLEATLRAAAAYPDATIYVTGAAVSSNMAEAIAMRTWLVDHGISKARIVMEMKALDTAGNFKKIMPMLRSDKVDKIVLVTVLYHLRRSCILADSVFESMQFPCEVLPMAGVSDLKDEKLEARLVTERVASYRDLARAMHLYEIEDFQARANGVCLLKWAR